MNDHEPNLKMAVVCGFSLHKTAEADVSTYVCGPSPEVWWYMDTGALMLVLEGASPCSPWDPVHDWNKVFDYVVPALLEEGCRVYLDIHPNSGQVHIHWHSGSPYSHRRLDGTPRPVCEAAYEAWQQLEQS